MSEQFLKPDSWVILKIKDDEQDSYFYKLFSCWYGGYLDSDSWRLNSGITSIEPENDYFIVRGYSSTAYGIHPSTYNKLNSYNYGVLQGIIKDYDVQIINIEEYLKELKWMSK